MTDRSHIFEGIRRGHDLELVLPTSRIALGSPMVISNASAFSLEFFQEAQRQGIAYVWFLHDYTPVCKWRLFYPLAEPCFTCYLKPRWLPILMGAALIVWLSPLHREAWLQLYPELASRPYHLAPSPVDPNMFRDLGKPRSGVIAVQSLQEFKGRGQVLQWALEHPSTALTIVGNNPIPEDDLPPNCTNIPDVPYSEMNALYNRHEVFLHLPESPQPFERTCAEAYLAGCRVMGNALVGALSWPFFHEGREAVTTALRDSPKRFWEAVEQACG